MYGDVAVLRGPGYNQWTCLYSVHLAILFPRKVDKFHSH